MYSCCHPEYVLYLISTCEGVKRLTECILAINVSRSNAEGKISYLYLSVSELEYELEMSCVRVDYNIRTYLYNYLFMSIFIPLVLFMGIRGRCLLFMDKC
ncbi:hypothetical protein CDL12_11896 [Handroanthus impetiginosus]|uniref:Uncharacterized protein n=1 Tax=Handroanthus impetiginosus TaxID=429701 RepID=A0A2G9HD67_9LAMI|nr:hypothetical protein CDL12_11896 [Handroanthus impetiginosus]